MGKQRRKRTYEVHYHGLERPGVFDSLADAIRFARDKAMDAEMFRLIGIWVDNVVVGVLTDDANGCTLHKLKGWPKEGEEER